MQVADAASFQETLSNSGTPPEMELDVVLSSFTGICGASSFEANGALVEITMLGPSFAAGTFAIDGEMTSLEYFAMPGSQCVTYNFTTATGGGTLSTKATVFEEGMSGMVTITKVDATGVTGSFDVTFASGDALSGSFVAPACSAQGGFNGC